MSLARLWTWSIPPVAIDSIGLSKIIAFEFDIDNSGFDQMKANALSLVGKISSEILISTKTSLPINLRKQFQTGWFTKTERSSAEIASLIRSHLTD